MSCLGQPLPRPPAPGHPLICLSLQLCFARNVLQMKAHPVHLGVHPCCPACLHFARFHRCREFHHVAVRRFVYPSPGPGSFGWLGCFQCLVVSICVQVLVSTQVSVSLGLKPSDGTASHQVSLLNLMRNRQTVFSSARYVEKPAVPHWQGRLASSFPLSNFNRCLVLSPCCFNLLLTCNEVEPLLLCLSVIHISSWINNLFTCFVFSFFLFFNGLSLQVAHCLFSTQP